MATTVDKQMQHGRTPRGGVVVACMAILIAGGQWQTPEAEAQDKLPKLNTEGFTSSAVCGECHQAIHAVWQRSLHANAWSNAIFQAGYRRAKEAAGAEGAAVCLSCHAPTVRHTKDFDVKQAITAEGVTCDFCHSISAVELGGAAGSDGVTDPIRLTVGKVKYGPLRHAQSPVHEIIHSPLHTKSEFCAGCHEYRNRHGLTVLGTYSEWKASPYAKRGIQCQDCHMPLVPGRVVAMNIREKTSKTVNLHNISGSHDLERVRKAVTMKLEGTEWIGNRVWVYVSCANVGSGHCFPTGLPMHRAVLEVAIREGNREIERKEIPFELVTLDTKGRPIRREHEVFLDAARVRSDTRLKPMETRSIELTFRKVKASRLTVSVSLYYEYATETLVVEDGKERIEPVEMKFLIASAGRKIKKPR